MHPQRETLASRLGFILLSAGCAIGLGNVWRFPFIVGKYGGSIFVLLYLFFLAFLAFPILLTEMTVGRGSRANIVHAFHKLAHRNKTLWAVLGGVLLSGCLILMMYYTNVTGWLLLYTKGYISQDFQHCATPEDFAQLFQGIVSDPRQAVAAMVVTCLVGGFVCAIGVKKGVESVVKVLMVVLLLLMLVLAGYALSLPNAMEGLRFYLLPNWEHFAQKPMETVFAAMGQAFFTLSVGIGSMEIFGSYLDWKVSMTRECLCIIALDTLVALAAGLIIFPVCASQGIDVSAGPSLVFISLPNIFAQLPAGDFWGTMFFAFLAMAALTTVIAVFENLIAFPMDAKWMNRPCSALVVTLVVILLSLPCVLGFGPWSHIQPLGPNTTILDLEDFIVSQNLLPLGGISFILFCSTSLGWGEKNFLAELEAGQAWHIPQLLVRYWKYVLPALILLIMLIGYCQ